jgi:glutathionylspermidine synthase
MQRESITPRPDWQAKVEELGFDFHTIDGEAYWREDILYRFTWQQVDELESATAELHALCLDAVERIVAAGRYEELGLGDLAATLIERSWRASEPTLYGRMDLSYDGSNPPKLLEYNADTPTALFEASVVQWYWLEDSKHGEDQFNSLHEKLVARWKESFAGRKIHFASWTESPEDRATAEYLRDTCMQADIQTQSLDIAEIGWSGGDFVDLDDKVIHSLFKLYPWEWMLEEEFGKNIPKVATRWIEPAWKMLLSNKSILPLLWEFFPDHPNLLPAAFAREKLQGTLVRKPRLGREGEGVIVLAPGVTEPPAESGVVYQEYCELPRFGDDVHALVGSWIVGHEPAGIGIREDSSAITRNTSCFVPHCFDE